MTPFLDPLPCAPHSQDEGGGCYWVRSDSSSHESTFLSRRSLIHLHFQSVRLPFTKQLVGEVLCATHLTLSPNPQRFTQACV